MVIVKLSTIKLPGLSPISFVPLAGLLIEQLMAHGIQLVVRSILHKLALPYVSPAPAFPPLRGVNSY